MEARDRPRLKLVREITDDEVEVRVRRSFFEGADHGAREIGCDSFGPPGADDREIDAGDSAEQGSVEGLSCVAVADESSAEGMGGGFSHGLPE